MSIESTVLTWYYKNKRDFPFRNTREPYNIWVSEVMSQQTQMSRVVMYYERFIEMFPTVFELAAASEEQLLKAWEGLGYYSRVRNMQVAAQYVVNENAGAFPDSYEVLLKLKGVGVYTAAAIASICYNEQVAAVDGNVLRVFSRYMNYDKDILSQKNKNEVKNIMEEWMTGKDAGGFNQAFIELGATICMPTSPKCSACPLVEECIAYKKDIVEQLPVKIKKVKVKHENLNVYILINEEAKVYVEKQDTQFLGGMYLLPQFEDEDNVSGDIKQISDLLHMEIDVELLDELGSYKHVFSHKVWNMNVYLIPVKGNGEAFQKLDEIPIAHAHRNFLVSTGILETIDE